MLLDNKEKNSLIGKNVADAVPFSASRVRKPFEKKYWMRDDNQLDGRSKTDSVTFTSPTGANYQDLKVFLAIAKVAIDNFDLLGISEDAKPHAEMEFDEELDIDAFRMRECLSVKNVCVKGLCKRIGLRTEKDRRKSVVKSLEILSHMSNIVIAKGLGRTYTNWIYAPIHTAEEDDYLSVSFAISKSTIKSLIKGGIVYNIETAMKYTGRTLLLYIYMQSRKYSQGKKYLYNDYINHQDLIRALDLDEAQGKEQVRQMSKAFKQLEDDGFPKYEYVANKSYWKKQKKAHEISR